MKKSKVICPDCGKKGIKDINKHKRYCEKVPALEVTKEESKTNIPESPAGRIEIEQQQGGIIQEPKPQEVKPEVVTTMPADAKPVQPQQEQPKSSFKVTYEDIANSVHETLNNITMLWLGKEYGIEEEDLGRLNRAGAGLLEKYDKDGRLLKYSPELVYFMTISGIISEKLLQRRLAKGEK